MAPARLSRHDGLDDSGPVTSKRSAAGIAWMPINGVSRDELLHGQSCERAAWNGTHCPLRLGEGLPYCDEPATLTTRSNNRRPCARRDHQILRRYRSNHGKGLGAAGRTRLDWETFQPRLGRMRLMAAARGDSDDS